MEEARQALLCRRIISAVCKLSARMKQNANREDGAAFAKLGRVPIGRAAAGS